MQVIGEGHTCFDLILRSHSYFAFSILLLDRICKMGFWERWEQAVMMRDVGGSWHVEDHVVVEIRGTYSRLNLVS